MPSSTLNRLLWAPYPPNISLVHLLLDGKRKEKYQTMGDILQLTTYSQGSLSLADSFPVSSAEFFQVLTGQVSHPLTHNKAFLLPIKMPRMTFQKTFFLLHCSSQLQQNSPSHPYPGPLRLHWLSGRRQKTWLISLCSEKLEEAA